MSKKQNKTHLHCTVNGKERDDFVADNILLADYLREDLALTGTKIGCDGGECGCCTVLIDGVPQHASQLVLAHAALGGVDVAPDELAILRVHSHKHEHKQTRQH